MTDDERRYLQGIADKMKTANPVAWVCYGVLGNHDVDFEKDVINAIPIGTILYASPPQRSWIGLTDDEVQKIMEKTVAKCTELDDLTGDTARLTWKNCEAKLREKNGG
jgi:hypothetical protein